MHVQYIHISHPMTSTHPKPTKPTRFDQANSGSLMQRAMRTELLSAKTEQALAKAWRNHKKESAKNTLVLAHMRLVLAMAAKFKRYGGSVNDLIQEGSIGLMKALERFDPNVGVRFSTYAMWWIKASMQDYTMRNWSQVRVGSTSAQKALFFNLRRIHHTLEKQARQNNQTYTPEQMQQNIAKTIGVSVRDVAMMQGRLAGQDFSLNSAQSKDDISGAEWIDSLCDDAAPGAASVEKQHDNKALYTVLEDALQTLDQRESFIVRERCLNNKPRTLHSIGQEMGISKERVRQLEKLAFKKLKQRLQNTIPDWHHFL